MTHSELVFRGHLWLCRRGHTCFCEFATQDNETPDVIGWKSGLSTLIECKISRGDFLSDGKKMHRKHREMGLGYRRYYMCPWGMINPGELPPHWGLLWLRGNRVFVKKKALGNPNYNIQGELRFLSSMVRRADVRLDLMGTTINDWLKWENRSTRL